MVAAAAARAGETGQTLVVDLPFPGEESLTPFTRADVVVTGVDHSETSYEVRLFLNNAAATADTPGRLSRVTPAGSPSLVTVAATEMRGTARCPRRQRTPRTCGRRTRSPR
jgi:hypothetical protein